MEGGKLINPKENMFVIAQFFLRASYNGGMWIMWHRNHSDAQRLADEKTRPESFGALLHFVLFKKPRHSYIF